MPNKESRPEDDKMTYTEYCRSKEAECRDRPKRTVDDIPGMRYVVDEWRKELERTCIQLRSVKEMLAKDDIAKLTVDEAARIRDAYIYQIGGMANSMKYELCNRLDLSQSAKRILDKLDSMKISLDVPQRDELVDALKSREPVIKDLDVGKGHGAYSPRSLKGMEFIPLENGPVTDSKWMDHIGKAYGDMMNAHLKYVTKPSIFKRFLVFIANIFLRPTGMEVYFKKRYDPKGIELYDMSTFRG